MKHEVTIDLRKMFFFIIKRIWIPILCAAIAFVVMYRYVNSKRVETYTAAGTMYVYVANPNMMNYQYISSGDLNSAVQLIDTYTIVVKSNRVMDVVAERLSETYPGITPAMIASTIYMQSVQETGVVRVSCLTANAQLSTDICNAVLDVAPEEIKRVVGAGDIQIIDYAELPQSPNPFSPLRRAILAGLIAAAAVIAVLIVIFLLNHKVADEQELTDRYKLPVLASIRRVQGKNVDSELYRLSEKSPMDIVENYAKLRTNLFYSMLEKDRHVVAVTSSVGSEGKSTIAANLAISFAMSGKKVFLLDGDLRRGCQRDIFRFSEEQPGLTDVLVGSCSWRDAMVATDWDNMRVLPAGHITPNPGKLLSSDLMRQVMEEMLQECDLIILDTPPINIVSDSLILAKETAGTLFVVRQNFSDHREIRKALISAEMAGMDLIGTVFYGEKPSRGSFYSRKRYKNYYHQYETASKVTDTRHRYRNR